ncbi:hypothetical protein BY996DRAFT_6410255 [Phakopsora pachyrhizi]|nr:hypothetical protein BY996DRAFT_6410255 [Phakopsora pachyrhizi]
MNKHINDNLPNLGDSLFDNASYSQDNRFEKREDKGIENIQHHSDTNHHDLSLTCNLSSNLPPDSTPTNNTLGKQKASNSLSLNPESHKQGPKSTLASSYAKLYESKVEGNMFHVCMILLDNDSIYILRKKKYEVTKLNWEQQKWHLEKEQKDKQQHMELAIREKELQFAKDGKDKELEIRILMADKDCEAMKLKENNSLLFAVVESLRSV